LTDAILSGLYVVRALYVGGTGDSFYPNRNDPRIRNADIASSVVWAGIHLGSAYYGDVVTSRCAAAESSYAPGRDTPATAAP
jgi:hypothetical protein